MNIAVFVKTYPMLSETFIRHQVQRLNARVYCQTSGKIVSYESIEKPSLVLGELPLGYRLLRRANGIVNRYYDPISLGQEKKLSSALARDQIDVVLIQYGSNAIKIGRVCRRLVIPYVIHFHGYDLSSLLRLQSYSDRLREVVAESRSLVVVNSLQERFLAETFGVGCDKISVIPCGVDTKYFTVDARRDQPNCVFVMVGRLTPKKAPLLTLSAFELVASKNPAVELRIIGDGPEREHLLRTIAQSQFRDKITYLGARGTPDIRSELAKSDVFLQHSVTAKNGDTEGWPISIAEACSMELPIVATIHPGIVDQVCHGQNGYLVSEFDVKEMAKYMLVLSGDRVLRRKMGTIGRSRMVNTGNIDIQIDNLRCVLAQ